MHDNIKEKLQNEIELTSHEVEYLYFVNMYYSEYTYEELTPKLTKYKLTIADVDNYLYSIYFIRNMRTGVITFTPQVALKEAITMDNDNIKHKLQNELELTSNEVKYLFYSGYATEFTEEELSPRHTHYKLPIFDDENYLYSIYVIKNTRTGIIDFPTQIALKEKME